MLWVAEVGSAHRGVLSLAYEFIRAFSEAGATVLKFQLGWTKEAQEAQGLEYKPERFVDEWAADLRKWCDFFGVKLMASVWSMEGLATADEVGIDIYKVAYKQHGSSLEELINTHAHHYYKECFTSGKNVYCVSEYPTYPERLNMPLQFARQDYLLPEGYSDHTHGIEACLLAVARGATYIEKHVCLSKSDLITKDTPFSATPDEFENMVKIGNGIERILHATI
jgi:sialic acid synthase SpsE